jgi:glycosyltransferase involved in cell wall biosynthesis
MPAPPPHITVAETTARPLRILMLVHGYPPQDAAGTEEHTRQVANNLSLRGHRVRVLAATRIPGRAQYSVTEDVALPGCPTVARIVGNLGARPLADGESDRNIDRWLQVEERRFRPDLIHAHHTQFLSCSVRFDAPVLVTLHDAWAWCAAGGQLVQPDGRPCAGPAPARCAPCHGAWRPTPGPAVGVLTRVAGRLAPVIPPDRLHRLYQRLPSRFRLRVARGQAAPESSVHAQHRNDVVLGWHRAAAGRLAPSMWLAKEAERQGLGPVEVLGHGIADLPHADGPPVRRHGFLFLGTISRHKGPDLVVEAWRRAFPNGSPGLRLHGAVVEPEAAIGHPVGPRLDRAGVADALRSAQAVILGSRWAENAPLVILEARAAGCPVIAPASGGIPELVEQGRDGLLYAPGDVVALTAALRQLVDHPTGPSRPPRGLDDHVDALLGHYGRLLGGPT